MQESLICSVNPVSIAHSVLQKGPVPVIVHTSLTIPRILLLTCDATLSVSLVPYNKEERRY